MKAFLLLACRALVAAVAAVSLGWGVLRGLPLASAAGGAALGVAMGQWLGRSRLRAPAALGLIALCLAPSLGAARLLGASDALVAALGTGWAIVGASALRAGGAALGAAASLRLFGSRSQTGAALEIGALAAALPAALASHRQGVVARPLWLGDWAWRKGIDPAHALLAAGAVGVVALTLVLLAQGGGKRARSSLLVLAMLALGAFAFLRTSGLPSPPPPGLGASSGSASGSASAPPPPPPPSGRPVLDGGTGDGGEIDAGDGEGGMPEGGAADAGAASEQLDRAQSGGGQASPMAVVTLDDDYQPPSERYYFRQEAWSQWNGTRLVRAASSDIDNDVPERFPTEPTRVEGAPGEAGRQRVSGRVAMLVDHERPFALEAPALLEPAPNPAPGRFRRAYRFVSLAQATPYIGLRGLRAGDPSWTAAQRARYLEGPSDPRYAELAAKLRAKLPEKVRGEALAQALSVKFFLDEEAAYSLKHRHAGAADPTADFLFGDRIGYCVHFAHAAVLLWRTLGLPARVGSGYMAQEADRHGGSTILLRSGDAHAWPELYLEGIGWVVLDVAPRRNLDPPAEPQDDELQRMLGEMARGLPPPPEKEEPSPVDWAALGRQAVPLASSLAALALVLLHGIKIWRRLAPRLARPSDLPRVGYRAALDALAEAGLSRREGESREAFAARVGALCPSFEAMTRMHLRGALGAPRPPGDSGGERDRAAWLSGLRSLGEELSRARRRPRRIVGLIDPVSFLRSR